MPVSTLLPRPNITIDGNFSDWVASERIDTPGDFAPGYNVYGTVQDDTYYIAIQATVGTAPIIGPGTTVWLNTDQNTATGYSPFDNVGADYNITYVGGSYYLYTGAAGQNLVTATPLAAALSPDGESIEIAVPRSLLTPTDGPAPTNINIDAQIDTGTESAVYLPPDYNSPEYTITDPGTLLPQTNTHKVAIVYSDTSANLFFSKAAYSDLFMAAQNQARMAGVSYDLIDESQLTDIKNLIGYSALIFPSMPDVDTTQLQAIMTTLTSAVYNYHIGIITAGDFLTNDQGGNPLPGNSYANMETLIGLARYAGGNSANVTLTVNDAGNPIMTGYSAGQTIQTYANEGYSAYQGFNTATDILVNQNVTDVGTFVGTLPGVQETVTGGTNVHFATTDMEGDSNLLSHVIQSVVLGTDPGVSLHISRDAGIVVARMDMDQSQFPIDVTPDGGGQGIYDVLIPILHQWNQQYDFVGSYYINIGDNPNGDVPSTTDWATVLPYYRALLAMGGEIGNHSYTHMINPPTVTFTATTVGDTPAGSTQIMLDSVPSFAGTTISMLITGQGLGENSPLPGPAGDGGAVANTMVTTVSGDTIGIGYVPGGFGTPNIGTIADIPANTTLTFSIPALSTNFLQDDSGTVPSGVGSPFTFNYEFYQSKLIEQEQLGITIYGAAIPGANESYATDQHILPYYQTVPATATTPGYTGYLSGGWTGIGSGYPSAFGYMTPSDTGSVYIAPNITFDFTELQYQGRSIAQTQADWQAQFNALGANAAGTPVVVWPIHDYGVAAWDTNTHVATGDNPTAEQPFTTQLFTNFVQMAYNANYEFVTAEELASRIAAQQKASIDYTTSGNTITATVTPDPTAPNLGAMALDVINGGTNVIQNVTNWYAYNAQQLFLPDNGGSFTINLGATQDDVTHISSLPMRADLISVSGDGLNLSFSMTGTGDVQIDLGAYGNLVPVVTGAAIANLASGLLDLSLTGTGVANVTVNFTQVTPTEVVSTVAFSADTGASATDFITATPAQTITGTLSAPLATGDVVKLSLDNGATWLSATAATGGTSFSLAGVTLAGNNTLIARVENATGLASAALTQAYVLDPTPPPEIATIVAMTNDSGVTGDFITNNGAAGRTVSGTLSSPLAIDETLQVSSDGGASWANATVAGSGWTALDGSAHAADWIIEARVMDLAGNTGAVATQSVTFDATPPPETATIVAMTNDSGVAGDFITNNGATGRTLLGTLSSPLVADETLQVSSDGGANWVNATVTGTGWTALDGAAHAADWIIEARVMDLAGNTGAVATQLVTFDTTPPPEAATIVAMTNDSGIAGDFITNNGAAGRTVSGTLSSPLAAGETLQVSSDGGASWTNATVTGTGWTMLDSTAHAADWTINARVVDLAGNTGAVASQVVTLDAIPPPETATIVAMTNDSGVTGDFITNSGAAGRTVSGTLSSPLATDETLQVSSDAGASWANATVTGTGWSVLDGLAHATSWTIQARVMDLAGNIGAVATQSVAFDATPPTETATIVAMTDDSGIAGDFITNNGAAGRTVSGTLSSPLAAGETLQASSDGGATWASATVTGTGWTALDGTAHATDWTIEARVMDLAGNTGAVASQSVTFDATPDETVSSLLFSSDTGASATDFITATATQTITGTLSAALAIGDVVKLSLDNGATWLTATAAAGATSFSLAGITLAGSNTLIARVESATGPASAAFTRAYVLDQASPPETATIVAMTNDSGIAGDFITNNGSAGRAVSGTLSSPLAADETLQVSSDGGANWANATVTGTGWTMLDGAAHAADWTIAARVVDLAGNIGAVASQSVAFDATLPAETAIIVAMTSDSGIADFVTNNGAAGRTVSGTLSSPLAAGETLQVSSDGGASWANATVTGSGWTMLDGAAHAADWTIAARVVDLAGNAGTVATKSVTFDATPPAETATIVAMTNDSGIAGDFITNNGAAGRTVSGTLSSALATGETLQVSSDGGASWANATVSGTAWTALDSTAHAASWTIAARVVDLAGNTGAVASQLVTFDAASLPETATIVAMTNDSGIAGDFITNNGAAGRTVSGTLSSPLAADETLQVSSDGGASWTNATVSGTGWTALDGTAHAASWTIAARVVDLAGNTGAVATRLVTFDATPPAVPGAPDLTAASDSGLLSTDNITKVTTPTFTGTAEVGSTVTLRDGANVIGSGLAAVDGTWSITAAAALANGVHGISAVSTDAAGNASAASVALSVTIDTVAPGTPTAPDLLVASDSGKSATDNLTNVTTPTFTGAAAGSSTVTLYDGTTAIGSTVAAANGAWTITASALLDGVHSITAKAMDAAGNVGLASAALAVTIDSIAPVVSTPDMTAATDKGVSNTDNITSDTTPTFTGTAEAGSAITLLDGTTVIGTATATGAGAWTITATPLDTGSHAISATAKDAAGNLSAPSPALAVTIDTGLPAAPTTPDLVAASDSGVSSTDNITNVITPTFTGTAEAGATVTLFSGAATVGTGLVGNDGVWTITSTALANGVRSITAKATDIVGNVSPASAPLSVAIDTNVGTPARPALLAASDSGKSATDNVTNVTTPTFTGTAEAYSTVTLFDGTTPIGTAVATAAATWSATVSPLADGAHSITVRAVDLAGNTSAVSAARVVTVDTTAPIVSTPDMTAATDKGVSNTDNITSDTTPTFTGTAEAGSAITLLDGTTVIGTANANANGVWTITATLLATGDHAIRATAKDAAGNLSAPSPALAVTIDTGLPAAPTTPDLVAASDSGVSSIDNITNVTTPTFTGTAEAGSTVTLFNGAAKVGTGLAGAGGVWTITSSALGNGTRSITAKATDIVGNVSPASAPLSVVIDTNVGTPARPTLLAASDSGVSNTDNLTKVTTPTFTGTAEAGSTVTLFDGTTAIGTALATAAGSWSAAVSPLADGAHSITVRAVDVAGNTSALSAARAVTVDTQPPAAPSFTTGNIAALGGKGEAGATVTVSDGTGPVGTATVGPAGNWNMAFLPGLAPRTLTAMETDRAGNTSAPSGADAIIGTVAADTLSSTPGNDFFIGGAGADRFSLAAFFGRDVIADFATGGIAHDVINFHGSAVLNSFANVLSHTTTGAAGAVISLDANNSLTLNGVSTPALTAANFTFV